MADQIGVVTGGYSVKAAPPPVRTHGEAIRYMTDVMTQLQQRREACNVIVPDNKDQEARQQRRAERQFLIHIGKALEAASLLCAFGLLDQTAYEAFHQQALNTMAPSLVGSVR